MDSLAQIDGRLSKRILLLRACLPDTFQLKSARLFCSAVAIGMQNVKCFQMNKSISCTIDVGQVSECILQQETKNQLMKNRHRQRSEVSAFRTRQPTWDFSFRPDHVGPAIKAPCARRIPQRDKKQNLLSTCFRLHQTILPSPASPRSFHPGARTAPKRSTAPSKFVAIAQRSDRVRPRMTVATAL